MTTSISNDAVWNYNYKFEIDSYIWEKCAEKKLVVSFN